MNNGRKLRRPLMLCLFSLLFAALTAQAAEIKLEVFKAGRACTEIKGGYVPPRKPGKWGDTRYLEVTPAMTLMQGNVLTIEMANPQPGATAVNLGGFLAPGMKRETNLIVSEKPLYVRPRPADKDYTLVEPSTALRAIFQYPDGTRAHLNRVCPGLMLEVKHRSLKLFVKTDILAAPYRVTGKGSVPPAYMAFVRNGKVQTVPARPGRLPLNEMDEAWIVAWWDGKAKYQIPLRPKGGGPRRNIWPIYPANSNLLVGEGVGEWPVLVVLQKKPRSVTATDRDWKFDFEGEAGRVIIAPLFGRRWIKAEEMARWKKGLPAKVVRHARAWTRRLRRIPIDVRESSKIENGRLTMTETFTFERIEDEFGTKGAYWAPMPPIFGLSRAMGLPIEARKGQKLVDWDYLHRLGPTVGVDGVRTLHYTFELAMEKYLAPPKPLTHPPLENKKYLRLRNELRREIDKVLQFNRHMAPHHWVFGEMHHDFNACYFYQPGELFATLAWALPHLSEDQQARLKEYMRREYRTFSPFKEHAWGNVHERKGALRERYPVDVQFMKWRKNADPNLHNLYGAWAYLNAAGTREEKIEAARLAKAYVKRSTDFAGVEWDYGSPTITPAPKGGEYGLKYNPALDNRHQSFNSRLSGYIGCTRIARMVGDREAERQGMTLLVRNMALRVAQLYFDQFQIEQGVYAPEPLPAVIRDPERRLQSQQLMSGYKLGPQVNWTFIWDANTPWSKWQKGDMVFYGYINAPLYTSKFPPLYYMGIDLTPETGRFYQVYAKDYAELSMQYIETVAPTWSMAQGIRNWGSEDSVGPPELAWGFFMARAFALGKTGKDLYAHVDFPQAKFGDIYYLQKLSAALSAYAQHGK